MPHHEARGRLYQKLRMDSNYGLETVLFDTATIARRTSECSQTFGGKGLTQYESMKAYCQQTFRWIHFCGSEAFNSINVWTGKIFWLQISQNKNHGNREPKLVKVRTLPLECTWKTCISFSICL